MMMNARELYSLIGRSDTLNQQRALFELLAVVQVLATATLELAGERELATRRDPLTMRSRVVLGDFIELPRRA
jgi:hypothetical protein